MRMRDLLARDLVAVDADASIHEIADKMRTQDVGFVPVLSNKRVVGVVTDRDLVLRVLAPLSEPAMITAWDVMSRDPICIDEEATLDRAVEVMRDKRVRRLVVVQHDGTPLGVASLSDLSRYSEKALEVQRLIALKQKPHSYLERPNTLLLP